MTVQAIAHANHVHLEYHIAHLNHLSNAWGTM